MLLGAWAVVVARIMLAGGGWSQGRDSDDVRGMMKGPPVWTIPSNSNDGIDDDDAAAVAAADDVPYLDADGLERGHHLVGRGVLVAPELQQQVRGQVTHLIQ
jgi:hypothetical protein